MSSAERPRLSALALDSSPGGAPPLAAFRCDSLRVYVYPDRRTMGRAAAGELARKKRAVIERKGSVTCCYAAAPSQDDGLAAVVEDEWGPGAAETCILH
ncbi:MAG: hypothetical protein R6V05_05300, partial [Candidatus Brocadiia bacterium]